MNPILRNLIFFAAIALTISVLRTDAAGQQLRWQFEKGATFTVSLNQSTNILSRVQKRSKKIDNSLTLEMEWKIESIDDDGNATILQTIKQVQLELDNPELGLTGKVTVDTENPENEKILKRKGLATDLLKQVQPLVGLSFQVIMSARGEIKDVVVPESTMDELRAIPGSMRLRQLLTKAGLKDVLGQSSFTLPEKELKPGDNWNSQNSVQLPMGTYLRNNQYTVGETNTNVVDITLATTVAHDTTIPLPKDAPEIKLVNFSGSGLLQWNSEQGFMSSSRIENSIETDRKYRENSVISKVDSTIQLTIRPVVDNGTDK